MIGPALFYMSINGNYDTCNAITNSGLCQIRKKSNLIGFFQNEQKIMTKNSSATVAQLVFKVPVFCYLVQYRK